MDFGSKDDKSSLLGFFFFSLYPALVPSMSSMAWALEGTPLAMAEFEVCCEIESGSFDLS